MGRTVLAGCGLILGLWLALVPARAEMASYGTVDLTGLARVNWPLNPPGESYAMVCNVNGPDGFLSVRSGPGTDFKILRRLERLAVVTVDTAERRGHWVRVISAHRTTTRDGAPIAYRDLHVSGWAHDGYLCDFIDY